MNINILSLIFYFIFYSFVGWLLECVYGTIKRKKNVNPGFLYGPFCPIYGFGAVLLIVVTSNFLDNLLLLFIFSTVIISILEYLTGFVLETLVHSIWWDYSNQPFNLKGRICLVFSLFWGVLSVIFLKLVHPHIVTIFKYFDNSFGRIIIYAIAFYVCFDFILTLIHVSKLVERLKQFNVLYEDFLAKLEDAGENIEKVKEDIMLRNDAILKKIKDEFPSVFTAFPRFKSIIREKIKNYRKD